MAGEGDSVPTGMLPMTGLCDEFCKIPRIEDLVILVFTINFTVVSVWLSSKQFNTVTQPSPVQKQWMQGLWMREWMYLSKILVK